MSECSDQKNQNFGASNPASQQTNTGAVKVNLNEKTSAIFNANYVLSALQTFNTFNNVANKMFGIDARWFRAIPQQRSKDVILNEYTLSNVEDTPICLKVVVPNGTFPDSKYQYDLMGLEYEIPTEIQIDKKYWEENAGFGTAPQKKDIVYLPIPNKLYQVESSYLKRGFMEQETTWIINLRKYMTEASRKECDTLKETIDKYTVSEQELFGDALNNEYEKITDDKQLSPFNSTSRDIYKILDPNLKIVSYNTEFNGTIFSQGYYDMNTTSSYNAIEYTNPSGDEIKETYDRSLSIWINPQPINSIYDINWIQFDNAILYPSNYKISIKGSTNFNNGDVFTISRPGSLNFYATIIDNSHSGQGVYYCQIDQSIINYLANINPNWANIKGYKMKLKNPIILLNGSNQNQQGFKAAVYANQFIKVNYGSQEYIAILDNQLNDNQWYGIIINIGNTWSQYNIYVWEQDPTNTTTLRINFYKTVSFVPEYVQIDKYFINQSPSFITNIRLFKTTIEEEKQEKELISYLSKDSDQALILDNCDLKFTAPYISIQR